MSEALAGAALCRMPAANSLEAALNFGDCFAYSPAVAVVMEERDLGAGGQTHGFGNECEGHCGV